MPTAKNGLRILNLQLFYIPKTIEKKKIPFLKCSSAEGITKNNFIIYIYIYKISLFEKYFI